jgi:mono/diheme cytochrome c family protein
MKYAMMMALVVACGDADPKPETKKEAPKKEVAKPAPKAEAKKEAPKAEAKPAEKSADKTETAPEAAPEAAPVANVSTARTGEQVYTQVCVTCHQANGEGMTGVYPPLAGSDWMAKSNETLIKIVLHGLMGEIEVKGAKYNNVMSPWGSALNDEEVANVLTYVRSSWGNTGDAVKPEEVKAVRDANQGHPPWQAAEL